jgi:hypothetical protein
VFNSRDGEQQVQLRRQHICAAPRERRGVRSLGPAGVCRLKKKTVFIVDGHVSPGKPRGVAAMDHVSVHAWELAAARGTAACVTQGGRSMPALATGECVCSGAVHGSAASRRVAVAVQAQMMKVVSRGRVNGS